MKSIWDNSWFVIPTLLFFNVGLLLAYYLPYGNEILYLNTLRREPFSSIFRFITRLGEAYAFFAFGIAALFWRYRYAVLIALAGLVTILAAYFVKESFGTDRPITYFRNQNMEDALVTVPGVILNAGQTSFPSGHTMAAFALYSLLALFVGQAHRRWGLALALLAALVGVSRVFLAQHFLADVLAGAALGLLVGWAVWRLDQTPFFQEKRFLDGRIKVG